MNKFATRIILATSLLAMGIVLLLGGILVTSSVAMMRGQAIRTARGVTQLVATQFEQKRKMRMRILETVHGLQIDTGSSPDEAVRLDYTEEEIFSALQSQNVKGLLSDDLAELAEIIQASQIALILSKDIVVVATTEAADETLLDEAAILVLWQKQQEESATEFLERRYGSSVVILTTLDSLFLEQKSGLLIQLPMVTVRRTILSSAARLSMATLAIAAAALLCSILLSRSISKPLSGLTRAVSWYSKGNLEHSAPVAGPSETQLLGTAFNEMARSLESHIEELQQETRRREQLETEFRIAARLQHSLLPEPGLYQFDKLQLLGWNEQAKEVGGDFFDYWALDDQRTAVVIGDAAGKGVTAALLAARCLSVLQTVAEHCADPAEILYQANNALCRQFKLDGYFVTVIIAIIDHDTGELCCSLAGHNPAFFLAEAGGTPERLLSKTGLPLGVTENTPFETLSRKLHTNSTLLLYTDGVTEAFNPEQTLYGEARLEDTFIQHASAPLETLLQRHQEDLAVHRQGRSPNDDATIVLLRLT